MDDRRHKTLEQKLLSWIGGLASVLICASTYQVFVRIPEQINALSEKYALRSELDSLRNEVTTLRTEVVRIGTEQARRTYFFQRQEEKH